MIRKRIDVPLPIRSPVTGMAVLITVSENLRASLGNGADDFVDLLQKFGEATKGEVIEASRETFEKALLQTKSDMQASMGQLEVRIETKLGDLRAEIGSVRAEIGSVRAEMGQLEGRLEAKIAGTEGRLEAMMGALRGGLEAKLGSLKGDLEAQIARSQATMIRWMFAFWVAQSGITFGLLMAFLRK